MRFPLVLFYSCIIQDTDSDTSNSFFLITHIDLSKQTLNNSEITVGAGMIVLRWYQEGREDFRSTTGRYSHDVRLAGRLIVKWVYSTLTTTIVLQLNTSLVIPLTLSLIQNQLLFVVQKLSTENKKVCTGGLHLIFITKNDFDLFSYLSSNKFGENRSSYY